MDKEHAVALQLMNETAPKGISYKVNTRRSDHDFALDTNAMNLDLGDYLTDKRPDLVVKMHQPDMILRVEVRREAIYLWPPNRSAPQGLSPRPSPHNRQTEWLSARSLSHIQANR